MAMYKIRIPYSAVGADDLEFYESQGFEFDDGVPREMEIDKSFRRYKNLVEYLKSVPMSVFTPPNTIIIFPRKSVRLLWTI